jgi:hypothetical protein
MAEHTAPLTRRLALNLDSAVDRSEMSETSRNPKCFPMPNPHLLGEHRYNLRCTFRAAPACVTTRWNRRTIPPRCALPDTARNAPRRPSNCRFQVEGCPEKIGVPDRGWLSKAHTRGSNGGCPALIRPTGFMFKRLGARTWRGVRAPRRHLECFKVPCSRHCFRVPAPARRSTCRLSFRAGGDKTTRCVETTA